MMSLYFVQNHDAEVQIDLIPILDRWILLQMVDWIYGNDLYTGSIGADFGLIQQ